MQYLKFFVLLVLASLTRCAYAQNVGIGIHDPVEVLDIDGALRLKKADGYHAGTIQWNPLKRDFEGYVGNRWMSLTGGNAHWGNREQYATENTGIIASHTSDTAFGEAVAFHNGRLAIAIPKDENGIYDNSGKVDIMTLSSSGYYGNRMGLYSPSPINHGFFGKSIALHQHQLVVGEPGALANGNTQEGKAYLYTFDANNQYSAPQELVQTSADGDPFDRFGTAVAFYGDHIAIGAPEKSMNGNARQGKVYTYRRFYIFGSPTDAFFQDAGFTAPDGAAEMQFGKAMDVSPDRLVVSAPHAKVGGNSNAGKVYIYNRVGNTWQHEATISSPYPNPGLLFGHSVSINTAGDTLAVGTPGSSVYPGDVYLFIWNGTTWQFYTAFNAGDGTYYNAFGYSVHLEGSKLLVGSPAARVGINNMQGKVFLYSRSIYGWSGEALFTPQDGVAYQRFGTGVAITPDMVIAGASGYFTDFFRADKGKVYFFFRN